jgi:threonine/homoserine/homoserine lactone efflux protein
MILLYIIIGVLLSAVGAVPLGASNIAVITTSTKESLSKGLVIAHGAGFGEVVLAFIALTYSKLITTFFEMNAWIQVSFIILFFIIGLFFLFLKKIRFKIKNPMVNKRKKPKFLTGFLLAMLNPPVLIFWVIAISLTQKYMIPISSMSPFILLLLFFTGVYIGKFITLYFYGKISHHRAKKQNKERYKLYRVIGIVLIVVSTLQGIRFFIS